MRKAFVIRSAISLSAVLELGLDLSSNMQQ